MSKSNSQSLIAWEDNDCTVWAFYYALRTSYDQSHKLCREYFHRECKKGVRGFDFLMRSLIKVQFDFERKGLFKEVTRQKARTVQKVGEEYLERKTSIKTFLSNNPVGTFMLSVRGHTVAVIEGCLMEAPGVRESLGRRVLYAYELMRKVE